MRGILQRGERSIGGSLGVTVYHLLSRDDRREDILRDDERGSMQFSPVAARLFPLPSMIKLLPRDSQPRKPDLILVRP